MINTLQSMMAENEGKVNKERDRKNKKEVAQKIHRPHQIEKFKRFYLLGH